MVGEPNYKQLFDGMMKRHDSNPNQLYMIALACGPLQQPRYINPKIEVELHEFKVEIQQKFESSKMNQTF